MQWATRLQRQHTVPEQHRRNFLHLYFDIAWFGVLNGSFISFSAVYLTRIGATTQQLSWFTAVPALVALLLSLPAGYWLRRRRLDRTVFWTALLYRLYYLFWLLAIMLLPAQWQVNTMLGLILVMSIPGTVLAISFNSLFAAVVPPDWYNHVIGIRHALLALTSILTTLLCGYLLEAIPFPHGYFVLFLLAVIGSGMSTVHLWFIREPEPHGHPISMSAHTIHIKEAARPGFFALSGRIRPSFGFRYLRQRPRLRFPRFVILRGDFGRAMGVIFFLHFALYLTNPLYYPYWVDELRYADQLISVGTALFYIFQFAGSTRLAAISRRLGERRALAVGAFLLAAYPGLTALSGHPAAFFSASILGGTGWGIAGGAVLAYLLALVPVNQRPQYMAWNSLLVNLAILTGALTAPFLSEWAGLRGGIGIAALVRLGSVLVILTLGKISQERGERRGAKRE